MTSCAPCLFFLFSRFLMLQMPKCNCHASVSVATLKMDFIMLFFSYAPSPLSPCPPDKVVASEVPGLRQPNQDLFCISVFCFRFTSQTL